MDDSDLDTTAAAAARDRDDGTSPLARRLGSEEGMASVQRAILAVALAFLFGAAGYFVGVRATQEPTSPVDIGFLQDMSEHHDQAVEMAQLTIPRAVDPVVRSMAEEILIFQRYELGQMSVMLEHQGAVPAEYDPDRITMAWMGMPTPLRNMPGMASERELADLTAATGTEVDRQFLELMINHHRGGLHMAEYAAANAVDPSVRELAGRMARYQAVEVEEYEGVQRRLSAS